MSDPVPPASTSSNSGPATSENRSPVVSEVGPDVGVAGHSRDDDADLAAATVALRSLISAVHQFRQALAATLGVGLNDVIALTHLAGGPMSPTMLADQLGHTTSGATSLIDRLENSGLARRTPRPGDRRSILVSLTSKGLGSLDWTSQWANTALRSLGPDQLSHATDLLSALASALSTQSAHYGSATSPAQI